MDTSQSRKSIILHNSQKLNFPQSLELEAAHSGINDVVKNWCKVEFSEVQLSISSAIHLLYWPQKFSLCSQNPHIYFPLTFGEALHAKASHLQRPFKASSNLSLFLLDLLCSLWQMIFHPRLCASASATAVAAILFSRSRPGVGLLRQHKPHPPVLV